MKALVWTDVETMEWLDSKKPEPNNDEVLIRVDVVGICGSEIEGYTGHNSLRKPPLVMGHEFCGYIEGFGTQVAGFSIGQKVVVNPLIFCGKCDRCLRGREQLCVKRQIVGIHRPGAFAEYVVVPQSCVVVVPDELSPYRMALSEPLACSLRAVRRAFAGQSLPNVIVFGAGGIGLLCAMVARIMGAAGIMIVDTNPERLTIARKVGADFTVNPRTEDLTERAKALFGSKGVDLVIDAAGFQPTREAAVRILNPGGTLMNIGLGIEDTVLPINYSIRSEIDILGSFCYTPLDFKDAVGLLVSGQITEENWTEVRRLEDGGGAFADLVAGKVINGKILLKVAK